MAIIGTGTTITFGTSSFTAAVISIGQIASNERVAIETSHMGTTDWHTFLPGKLVDGGELQFQIAFAPAAVPPITGPAETITIAYPGGTYVGSGFVTNYTPTAPLEERMTADITIKWTGALAQAAT